MDSLNDPPRNAGSPCRIQAGETAHHSRQLPPPRMMMAVVARMRSAVGLPGRITTRAKTSVPLKADEVGFLSILVLVPKPQPDVTLRIDAGGVLLRATFKGKNSRKSMKAVISGCFVVIQGRFAPGGEIIDPGTSSSPRNRCRA